MKFGSQFLTTHCTLPDELAALRSTFEQQTGTSFPPWPLIPGEQFKQVGWRLLKNGQPAGAALLQGQTKTRGLLGLAAGPERVVVDLLTSVTAQAEAWQLKTLLAYFPAASPAALDDLAAAEFTPAGKVTLLETAPPMPELAVKLPGEYFFKRFDELNHPPTLAATLNRAYADRTGRPENEHGTVTVDSIDPALARRTWLLLNFFGKGVAVIRSPSAGWLEAPGVAPEERTSGLHAALLAQVLRMLPDDAVIWRMISFNDPDTWLEDYTRAGFRISRQFTLYQKDL